MSHSKQQHNGRKHLANLMICLAICTIPIVHDMSSRLPIFSFPLSFLSPGSLLRLMADLATAYQALCTYDLGMAVRLFQSLPPHHRDTAWVKSLIARAYFAGERFKKVSEHKLIPSYIAWRGVRLISAV